MPKKKIDEKLQLDSNRPEQGQAKEKSDDDSELVWCEVCGERIGRQAGTFTGWIFRSVTCSCPSPSPTSINSPLTTSSNSSSPTSRNSSSPTGSNAEGKLAASKEAPLEKGLVVWSSFRHWRTLIWLSAILAACYATWLLTMLVGQHKN